MTERDLTREEVAALLDGTTEGPWKVFIDDTGGRWTGWPLSIDATSITDKMIVRTGGQWPYEWDAATSQVEAVANAHLIAASPTLAAQLLRCMDEVTLLRTQRDALIEAEKNAHPTMCAMRRAQTRAEADRDAMAAEVARLREYVGALEWFAEISGPDAVATKKRTALAGETK